MKIRKNRKVVFLDRDGTLIYEPWDTKQVDESSKLRILPGVIKELKRLRQIGYVFVIVTNQDGLGTNTFPIEKFDAVQEEMLGRFRDEDINFYRIFICSHFEDDHCDCRKPKTGLVAKFLSEEVIDFEHSFVLGDRDTDMEFARNIGVSGYKVKTNRGLT